MRLPSISRASTIVVNKKSKNTNKHVCPVIIFKYFMIFSPAAGQIMDIRDYRFVTCNNGFDFSPSGFPRKAAYPVLMLGFRN